MPRAPPGLTWHLQLLCQPLAEGLGTQHTLVHGDAPHWDEGADIQGAHAGVLPCNGAGEEWGSLGPSGPLDQPDQTLTLLQLSMLTSGKWPAPCAQTRLSDSEFCLGWPSRDTAHLHCEGGQDQMKQ